MLVTDDCSWNPQPTAMPEARIASSIPPIMRNATRIPAVYNRPFKCVSLGSVPAISRTLIALRLNIGKTQGIKLRRRPPINAAKIAPNRVWGLVIENRDAKPSEVFCSYCNRYETTIVFCQREFDRYVLSVVIGIRQDSTCFVNTF